METVFALFYLNDVITFCGYRIGKNEYTSFKAKHFNVDTYLEVGN